MTRKQLSATGPKDKAPGFTTPKPQVSNHTGPRGIFSRPRASDDFKYPKGK